MEHQLVGCRERADDDECEVDDGAGEDNVRWKRVYLAYYRKLLNHSPGGEDVPAPRRILSNTLFSNVFCSLKPTSPPIPGPPAPTPSSMGIPVAGTAWCGGL